MIHQTDYDAAGAGAPEAGRHITSPSPQPCWMALDAARDQAFTGEIVFDAEPEVRVYLDNGVAYYAERADDDTLGRRLIDAGLIDAVQLERGMVRVGDVEHLGRLFDRDPTVDRDAVMVVTEDATEHVLADLANNVIAASRSTAYRHHESGVHRWFVAPVSGGYMTRPVSDVAPLDNSVVEDLPGLPSAETGSIGDELRIEWDLPIADLSPTPDSDESENTFEHDLLGTSLDTADIVDSPFGERAAPAEPAPFAPPVADVAEDVQFDLAAPAVEIDDEPDSEPTIAPAVAALDALDTPTPEQSAFDADPLVIDLDALLAPVDEEADEPGAEADPAIDVGEPVVATEVIVPLDEDFLVVWPDGTEDTPIAPAADTSDESIDETITAPIAGEVLLPGRPAIESEDRSDDDVEPAGDHDLAELTAAESTSTVDDVVVELAGEPVVELTAEPEVDVPDATTSVVDELLDVPESVVDVVDEPPAGESAPPSPRAVVALDTIAPELVDEPPADDPSIDFDVPALVLNDFPSAEGAVPDDVSSAVLRAIRAIENASTAAPHVAPIPGADTTTAPAPAPAPVEPAPAPMGFAPPTLETSAEVMYAAAAAAAADPEAAAPSTDRSDADTFEPRVASVVFVDDEEEPEPEDRAGALRRLIGSLRRR